MPLSQPSEFHLQIDIPLFLNLVPPLPITNLQFPPPDFSTELKNFSTSRFLISRLYFSVYKVFQVVRLNSYLLQVENFTTLSGLTPSYTKLYPFQTQFPIRASTPISDLNFNYSLVYNKFIVVETMNVLFLPSTAVIISILRFRSSVKVKTCFKSIFFHPAQSSAQVKQRTETNSYKKRMLQSTCLCLVVSLWKT